MTIYALFESDNRARQAVAELEILGLGQDEISALKKNSAHQAVEAADLPLQAAHDLERGIEQGALLLSVAIPQQPAEDIIDLLENAGATYVYRHQPVDERVR